MEELLKSIRNQDVERIKTGLLKWSNDPEKLANIFFEILSFPTLLDDATLNSLFAQVSSSCKMCVMYMCDVHVGCACVCMWCVLCDVFYMMCFCNP